MKIVKVTYTANPEFAEQNQKNIQKVMADLQAIGSTGINYNSCVCADGKTFIHTAFFKSEEEHKILNALPSFLYFQEQLKLNGFKVPPKQEQLSLVGTSVNIF